MWSLVIVIFGVSSHSGYGGPVSVEGFHTADACQVAGQSIGNSTRLQNLPFGMHEERQKTKSVASWCVNISTGEVIELSGDK